MAAEKTYYMVPILSEEKDQIRQANVKEQRKQVVADIFNSKRPRPSETEFFLFLIRETMFSKDFLFGFVLQFHSSSVDPRRKEATAFASFAFQNDGAEMFLAFRDKIKNTKKIPKREGIRILGSGLKDRYDNIRSKIWDALHMASTVYSSEMKTPIQTQEDNKIIKSYVDDLKKRIKQQDLNLIDQIDKARKQFLQSYVSKPSSLSLKKVSKQNRPLIQQIRKEHQKQLLEKYGKSHQQIPQQIDPVYRKKIIKYRMDQQKKRQQQQQLLQKMMPFKQKIKQYVHLYGQDFESLVETVVWGQLGLLDPVTLQRIVNPVILPASKTLVEKQTLQKIKEDPISRDPLPPNKLSLPINQSISQKIVSVEKDIDAIMGSSLPLNTKVFKLIQLRQKERDAIEDIRVPKKKKAGAK